MNRDIIIHDSRPLTIHIPNATVTITVPEGECGSAVQILTKASELISQVNNYDVLNNTNNVIENAR